MEHFFQYKVYRDNLPFITEKIIASKKRNGTLNTSLTEKETFNFLCSLGYSIEREYKDAERYPFFCDFYIKELDLFIELQSFYTHGSKPFTGSEEDLQTLNKLQKKNTESALSTIDVWSVRDVKKRNFAKNFNLNFLEIFSNDLDEIKTQIMQKINSLKDKQ